MACERCGGTYWVCEEHDATRWDDGSGDGCECGAPGKPCPDCNVDLPGVMPLDENGDYIVRNL